MCASYYPLIRKFINNYPFHANMAIMHELNILGTIYTRKLLGEGPFHGKTIPALMGIAGAVAAMSDQSILEPLYSGSDIISLVAGVTLPTLIGAYERIHQVQRWKVINQPALKLGEHVHSFSTSFAAYGTDYAAGYLATTGLVDVISRF